MANVLDITGLNGLKLAPQQIGVEFSATPVPNASGTYTVSATGNTDLTSDLTFFPPLEAGPNAPVTLVVMANRPSYIKIGLSSYYVTVKQPQTMSQSVHSAALSIKIAGFFNVVGWNADSILLIHGLLVSGTFTNYLVISDKTPAKGTPSDLTFGTTGAPPVIAGVNFPITCFAGGTRISTVEGLVAVEHLQPGDLVRTASGAVQPIVWVGMRHVRCAGHAQPARVTPVCIAADAFGPGLPVRDLHLSPEHAVFVDGALVPAHALVNGTTIRQAPVEAVTYYHIELPQHDVVLAEGLPAESYLDTGSRLAAYDRGARAA